VTPLDRNPFDVLGLARDCSAMEVERATQKALAMLAVGFEGAGTYASPLGPRPRDADLVRWAATELRDPQKRAEHAARVVAATTAEPPPDRLAGWPEALVAFGWGPR
jgi:hypothetical protein